MSTLICDAIQGLGDPTYTQLPTGIVDPACLQVVTINGKLRITIKKNSLDGSFFTGDFIPNGSITQAQLANNSVGTPQLQDGCVTTAKLADHCVTQIKLAFNAVTNTEIASGTILSGNIAPNAIVTNLINPGAVTGNSIAHGAITNVNFAPGAVDHAALGAACVYIVNLGPDVLSLIQTSSLPPGTILATARSISPTGYLPCDGSQISRSVYSSLFAAISTVYGPGDGATTFNVPDLRGRVALGAGAGPGLTTNYGLGTRGGEENHTLSSAEMPNHSHTLVDGGHTHSVNEPYHSHSVSQTPHGHGVSDPSHGHSVYDPAHTHTQTHGATFGTFAQGASAWHCPITANQDAVSYSQTGIALYPNVTGISIQANNANIGIVQTKIGISIAGAYTSIYAQAAGSSAPHNNLQPYLVCNYIIKT